MNNEELEDRLVDFSVQVSQVCAPLKHTELGNTVYQQLIRSTSSSALNYGESRGAESKKDFIHKLRISLKELRESYTSLKILKRISPSKNAAEFEKVFDECNQLISIFVVAIRTAENNKQ